MHLSQVLLFSLSEDRRERCLKISQVCLDRGSRPRFGIVSLLECWLLVFAFDGTLTCNEFERVLFVLREGEEGLVVPNFGRFRGIERLEVFGFGGLSHDNFAVGDLCLNVIDSLVVVEQSLWSGSLREVRLLQLAKMVVQLLACKFLGRVVIIGYVFSHSTETGLRHAAVTDLRLASLDIPRGNHNFSILVPEVFLDLLVIS